MTGKRQRGKPTPTSTRSGWEWASRGRALLVLSLIAGVLATATASATDEPHGDQESEPHRVADLGREPDHTLISGGLAAVVDVVLAGEEPLADVEVVDESITLEAIHELDDAGVEETVAAVGGQVLGAVPGLTLARVPADRVAELEAADGVTYLRLPLAVSEPVSPVASALSDAALAKVDGRHAAHTNAVDWQAMGHTGQGIKIGIIDLFHQGLWNAAQSNGELPAPAGTRWCVNGTCQSSFPDAGSAHGVAVAEVIHELAPDAELYLAYAETTTDLQKIVDYFDNQGVHIISRSLTAYFDGPGNGTGPLAGVVDDAVAKGMLWVNSAGNSAGRNGRPGSYWRGPWIDSDNDGWLEFEPNNPYSEDIEWRPCAFLNGLRWNDTGPGTTDYDVYLYENWWTLLLDPNDWEARLVNDQTSGAPPIEPGSEWQMNPDNPTDPGPCDGPGDIDVLTVRLYDPGSGTGADVLELMANASTFELWTNAYSASGPVSDTKSPGALSVGAMEPPGGRWIADYSSQGPTNDGRTKPDISAYSCIPVFAAVQAGMRCQDGSIGFNGTSAAAPVVSGLAAVVWDSGVARSPKAVRSFLVDNAIDRGPAGKDNLFGLGELKLKSTWPDKSLNVEIFETKVELAWKAANELPGGFTGYAIHQSVGGDGKKQGRKVGETSKGTRSFTVTGLQADTSYTLWVEALGDGGNVSKTGPLDVVTTATDFADTNGHVFEEDIAWLSARGITLGCNPPANDRFCPDEPVTRAEMASFLVRALGLTSGGGFDYFADDDTDIHQTNINRLAHSGITRGCNPPANDRFCPGDPVTRGQMAAFLVRALNLPAAGDRGLTDTAGSVFEADIDALAAAGVTKGCDPPANTKFCPREHVTRGQMAAFLRRGLTG